MPLPSEAISVGIDGLMSPEETGMATALTWAPEEFCEVTNPDPLSAIKNGLPGRKEIAQGLIKLCELFGATPGTLDARSVWRYAFV
jgi:hypothetical protein